MFTGRMPSAIGLRSNMPAQGAAFTHEQDTQSLGHVMKAGGYRTLYGGKTHWPIGLTPARLGFDQYFCVRTHCMRVYFPTPTPSCCLHHCSYQPLWTGRVWMFELRLSIPGR
jgi:arylsulfatase A-like enzyme